MSRTGARSSLDRHAILLVLGLFFLSGASGLVYQVIWVRLLTRVFGEHDLRGERAARGVHGRARPRKRDRRALPASRAPPPALVRRARDGRRPLRSRAPRLAPGRRARVHWTRRSMEPVEPRRERPQGRPRIRRAPPAHHAHVARVSRSWSSRRFARRRPSAFGPEASTPSTRSAPPWAASPRASFTIPLLGMASTTRLAAAVNGLVGLGAIALSWRVAPPEPASGRPSASAPESAHHPELAWATVAFTVSGFAALGLEVVWTRLLTLVFKGYTYSFTSDAHRLPPRHRLGEHRFVVPRRPHARSRASPRNPPDRHRAVGARDDGAPHHRRRLPHPPSLQFRLRLHRAHRDEVHHRAHRARPADVPVRRAVPRRLPSRDGRRRERGPARRSALLDERARLDPGRARGRLSAHPGARDPGNPPPALGSDGGHGRRAAPSGSRARPGRPCRRGGRGRRALRPDAPDDPVRSLGQTPLGLARQRRGHHPLRRGSDGHGDGRHPPRPGTAASGSSSTEARLRTPRPTDSR